MSSRSVPFGSFAITIPFLPQVMWDQTDRRLRKPNFGVSVAWGCGGVWSGFGQITETAGDKVRRFLNSRVWLNSTAVSMIADRNRIRLRDELRPAGCGAEEPRARPRLRSAAGSNRVPGLHRIPLPER